MARPVPSLGQWLGDGARAEGFEEWVRENLDHEAHIVDPNERAVLRMVNILSVACVEICRRETDLHGRDNSETLIHLGRAVGVALMAPLLCCADANMPIALQRLMKIVLGEVRHGAESMLRSYESKRR